MGGDDLGSDDELWTNGVSSTTNLDDSPPESPASDAGDGRTRKHPIENNDTRMSKKRKRTPDELLLEAGIDLEIQDADQQASFLNTAISHHTLLSSGKAAEIWKLQSNHFKTSKNDSLLSRLNDAVALKKMKKWKAVGSPCVIIVCLSARRAVTILKDLSALKIRVAKLFPKNGTVDEQCKQLSTTAFGVAVGTPHRLLALATKRSDGTNPLAFDETKLIILDSDVSNKQYTVCTLPDTAPHCMELLREFAIPQFKKRKDLHLAFF